MSKAKNVTFNLPPELIDKYKGYVQHKYIPSVNAGVREALEEYSKRMDKELLKSEMMKAVQDPLFMSDLSESMNSFENTDAEAVDDDTVW